ncbi:unnamed protein product [Closterium sp. Naga37s-1]|nr:unnamed protein product [Closterium sp. Naga37s-1]
MLRWWEYLDSTWQQRHGFQAFSSGRNYRSGSNDRSGSGSRGSGDNSPSLAGVKHIVAVVSAWHRQVHHCCERGSDARPPRAPGGGAAGRLSLRMPRPTLPLSRTACSACPWAFLVDFIMPAHVATVWRRPMVMATVEKLVKGTEWGRLDVLLGTGYMELNLSHKFRLSGAAGATGEEAAVGGQHQGEQVEGEQEGVLMDYDTADHHPQHEHVLSEKQERDGGEAGELKRVPAAGE